MRSMGVVLAGCFVMLLVSPDSHAQTSPAVPFLLMTSSPDGNGMGGISASTISTNPISVLANPGQLGIASLSDHFDFAIYPSFSNLPTLYWDSARTYMAGAVNAGIDLRRLVKLPFPIGVGLSYGHTDLTSVAYYPNSGPGNPPPVRLDDYANNWSVAVGINYLIRFGVGYTDKSVVSSGLQKATVHTYDLGFVALLPVMELINRISGDTAEPSDGWITSMDVGLGFSQRNMGTDPLTYDRGWPGPPQPRDAVLGMSYKAGLTMKTPSTNWEVVSITIAREAEDLLVEFFPPPTNAAGIPVGDPPPPQYLGGAGSIQFLNNVILGKRTGAITLRNGLEIGLAELAYLRVGAVDGPGVSYTTSGYGLRLTSLLKLLDYAAPSISSMPAIAFALRHVDVRFDHSSSTYDMGNDLNEGLRFDGLSLVVK